MDLTLEDDIQLKMDHTNDYLERFSETWIKEHLR